MGTSSVGVLVVDDYEPWRNFATKALRGKLELRVVGEASDGLEAVQKAQGLQPDLILLDIGLPTINGIQAARRILQHSPKTKILFVSEQRSPDIVEEALRTGAGGYLVKSDAASELLPAVKALLEGKKFLSASLSAHASNAPAHGSAITHSHEVAFYADDSSVVDGYARFIEHSLRGGKAVIVVVTESHRASLLARLEADGVDLPAVTEQGHYFLLDAADTLSRLTVNDIPDPVRCKKVVGELIMAAAQGVNGERARVAVCGETAPTLLAKGNAEGAVMLEHFWDEITRRYGVHTLCGYLSTAFPHHEADPIFQRICAEHSNAYSR